MSAPTKRSHRRTLVVPDIRTKFEGIEAIIQELEPDRVVFLGSYFDALEADTPEDNLLMAKWLKSSLWQPNRVHLLSVNDLQYAFDYEQFKQPNFNQGNANAIRSVLTDLDWATCRFHTWIDDCLLTAAGLDARILPEVLPDDIDFEFADVMDYSEDEAWEALLREEEHWFYTTTPPYGSLAYADKLRQPIPGIFQIHGFISVDKPTKIFTDTGTAVSFATIQPGDSRIPYFAFLHQGNKLSSVYSSKEGIAALKL